MKTTLCDSLKEEKKKKKPMQHSQPGGVGKHRGMSARPSRVPPGGPQGPAHPPVCMCVCVCSYCAAPTTSAWTCTEVEVRLTDAREPQRAHLLLFIYKPALRLLCVLDESSLHLGAFSHSIFSAASWGYLWEQCLLGSVVGITTRQFVFN